MRLLFLERRRKEEVRDLHESRFVGFSLAAILYADSRSISRWKVLITYMLTCGKPSKCRTRRRGAVLVREKEQI